MKDLGQYDYFLTQNSYINFQMIEKINNTKPEPFCTWTEGPDISIFPTFCSVIVQSFNMYSIWSIQIHGKQYDVQVFIFWWFPVKTKSDNTYLWFQALF